MALWIDANNAHKFRGAARIIIIAVHVDRAKQSGRHQHVAFHEVGMQAKINIQFQKIIEKCV